MKTQKTALEVIVDQKPGIINWNFEQLKTALAEKLTEYEGLVYTAETVPVAKNDIATLRKLKKSVSDKRVEIKKKCLEPYEEIEKQANELTELIDKPITEIAKQLDEYEKLRKEAVKAEILGYMEEKFSTLPKDIAVQLLHKIYDDRWENATSTKKSWKTAIDEAFGTTMGDLAVLDELEEEFKESALKVYKNNLILSEAMSKVTELRKQKEAILAKERERIALEEREKARKDAENQPHGVIESDNAPESRNIYPNTETVSMNRTDVFEEGIEVENNDNYPEKDPPRGDFEAILAGSSPQERINPASADKKLYILRISASEEQIYMIKAYIEHTGAVYREES